MRKVFLAIILLITVISLTPRLLVRFSLFLGNFAGGTEETTKEQSFLFAPTLEPLPSATNSATLSISGFSQGAERVEIFVNDISKEKVLVANDGSFYLDKVRLYEGENKIKAVSFNNQGNKSDFSKEIVVVYKKKGPSLVVETPEEEKIFSTDEKKIKIIGKTDPDVNVRINSRWVLVKNDGSFVWETKLEEGENLFEIIASDSAGNVTILKRSVTYSQD